MQITNGSATLLKNWMLYGWHRQRSSDRRCRISTTLTTGSARPSGDGCSRCSCGDPWSSTALTMSVTSSWRSSARRCAGCRTPTTNHRRRTFPGPFGEGSPPMFRTSFFWRFLGRAIERPRRSESEAAQRSHCGHLGLGRRNRLRTGARERRSGGDLTAVPRLGRLPVQHDARDLWLGPLIGIPDRKSFNALRRRPIGAKNPAERTTLPPSLDGLIKLDVMPTARRVRPPRRISR